jgi:hypothetical protein
MLNKIESFLYESKIFGLDHEDIFVSVFHLGLSHGEVVEERGFIELYLAYIKGFIKEELGIGLVVPLVRLIVGVIDKDDRLIFVFK